MIYPHGDSYLCSKGGASGEGGGGDVGSGAGSGAVGTVSMISNTVLPQLYSCGLVADFFTALTAVLAICLWVCISVCLCSVCLCFFANMPIAL